jgi:hypothetical protein
MWAAGHFMLNGHLDLLFDKELYNTAIKELFGPGFTEQMWGYPPVMGLLVAPLALLPLGLAFTIWTLAGLIFLVYALKKSGFSQKFIIVVLLSPALWESCLSGQTGAFTAAILVWGMMLSRNGLLLSFMIFKPQLAFIFPIKLLAEKAWRTIGGLLAGTIILISASIVWFGYSSWILFFTRTSKFMSGVINAQWTGTPAQADFSSVFIAVKSIGFSNNPAWMAQGIISIISIVVCLYIWKFIETTKENKTLKVAITLILTLLATPYAHDYDLVISAIAIAILFQKRTQPLLGETAVMAIAWVSPGVMVLFPLVFKSLAWASPVISVVSNMGVLFYCFRRLTDNKSSQNKISVASLSCDQ